MGLPLWQPRVESDIPSRLEVKDPAHARSRIRGSSTRNRGTATTDRLTWTRQRPALHSNELSSRERRRRLLHDIQMHERMFDTGNNPSTFAPLFPEATRRTDTPALPDIHPRLGTQMDYVFTDPPFRPTDTPERSESPVVQDLRQPYSIYASRLQNQAGGNESLRNHEGSRSELDAHARLHAAEHNRAVIGIAPQENNRSHRAHDRLERAIVTVETALNTEPSRNGPRTRRATGRPARLPRAVSPDNTAGGNEAPRPGAAARVDGLGDRDRSLSPEGDNAWDTLLTTLTPDPQPPSVGGSSFASAGSAGASRSAANESSGTSLTGPDTGAEESAADQPCESEDEDEEHPDATFDELGMDPEEFGGGARNSRGITARDRAARDRAAEHQAQIVRMHLGGSYADVVRLGGFAMPGGARTRNPPVARPAIRYGNRNGSDGNGADAPNSTDDLILELVGGLGGMQHIVRNLVRREDIPNDWWVDAGLSRTLPRDELLPDGL